jgi:hypothetical protein
MITLKMSKKKILNRLYNQNTNILLKKNTLTKLIDKRYFLSFRLKQNNIFCFLGEVLTNTTFLKLSSGNLKINVSKKTLKFNTKKIIPYFFSLIPKSVINSIFLVSLTCPLFLRRKLFLQICKALKKTNKFFFIINGKKSFNGCRVAKYKRKKRHKFRILKH